MPLLLPSICQTTYDLKYRPVRPEPPHQLTPYNEPLEIQLRRLMSCSVRGDPYHKPMKGD